MDISTFKDFEEVNVYESQSPDLLQKTIDQELKEYLESCFKNRSSMSLFKMPSSNDVQIHEDTQSSIQKKASTTKNGENHSKNGFEDLIMSLKESQNPTHGNYKNLENRFNEAGTSKQSENFFERRSSPFVPKIVKSIDKVIPSCKIIEPPKDSSVTIVILDFINPHRFWFAEYSEYKTLSIIMDRMMAFYEANKDQLRIDIESAQRGLYVAALFNGVWHRSMILTKLENNFLRVFYVDFGTVEIVSASDICYLKEDFLNFQAIARRGVIAYVQPFNADVWSENALIFFKDHLQDKKVEAKIFQHNAKDNSYYLGLKFKLPGQKTCKLLTDEMISQNLARGDLQFLKNEIVSKDCFEFCQYEDGAYLDIQIPVQNVDSWIPSFCSDSSKINSDLALDIGKKNSIQQVIPMKKTETPRKLMDQFNSIIQPSPIKNRKLADEFSNTSQNDVTTPESHNIREPSTSVASKSDFSNMKSTSENDIPQSQIMKESSTTLTAKSENESVSKVYLIKSQSYENLIIGSRLEIYIHSFFDISSFYFYHRHEMTEIKSYLQHLNQNYTSDRENLPLEELTINKEIVVFNDDNFCRGRINSIFEDSYQVFLYDFGVFVMKKSDEIFKLKKEFVKRQRCVYQGSFQLSVNPKKAIDIGKLVKNSSKNFIDTIIQGIQNGVVHMRLMDTKQL